MRDNEERMPFIVECPHCRVRVIPAENNVCPNCHEDGTNMAGVDPSQVPFTVSEREEFPPYCYSCNRSTDQFVRVSTEDESEIERLFFGTPRPENTTNIIVFLPACELCKEKEIELVEADYERQTMTIVVHRGFCERVLQYRQNPPRQVDENFDGEM